ncbi:MAG: UDP-N-acetylmuramoyl-tripeptide--D-alanyl-D-alanine ligase [Candidatus Omnitrophica bacterium]|nr:UDP-N-acetylmuramoyl-tripeptide--D-alanyl-D-alanine ligase [Candidatus Omnitrophota bacterium]
MFTVKEVVKAVGGKLLRGALTLRLKGVSTDTRKVKRGKLFVAIKGDRFDGHLFTASASAAGAVAVLVSRADVECPLSVAVILVKDTVIALGHLALFHRLRFKCPVIAVTGSAGKTTTKEFIAEVLSCKYRVLYTKGTENNHIGVPMALLQLNKKHQAAVIEAGTNHFGEIAWLGSLIRPDMVVFTNIGESHLAGLESPEGVFREKVSLLQYCAKKGTVVVNKDDVHLRAILDMKLAQKVLSYGIEQAADLKAQTVRAYRAGLEVVLDKGRSFRLATPVWGNVSNALAAAVCGQVLKVPFKDIAVALGRVKPAPGRQCFHVVCGVRVIDDTYNANPVSYYNAIRTLSLMSVKGKRVLVAADMLELGDRSEALHSAVGEAAARAGVDHIFTIGRFAGLIAERAREVAPAVQTRQFAKQEDIFVALGEILREGDCVLVKGSRGMHMDRLVEQMLAVK